MKIHFIGIGGIGVSALAKYYLVKGNKISGSDLTETELTIDLKKKGAIINISHHKKSNVPSDADLVIFSPAVEKTNPELKEAKRRRIEVKSYPEALGDLTKKHFTIAVSGTHGKSTTTALIALILVKANFDPTVIVGTKLKEFGNSNCRVGDSKYLVIEADEYFGSFLNYYPKVIVLTNIDKDHLDYYKNLNNILEAYKEYVFHLKEDGTLILNKDDNNSLKILDSTIKFKVRNYSFEQKEREELEKILKIPGDHNIYNALAALTAARALRIKDNVSFEALSEYKGAWRRFDERKITLRNKEITVIHDYGHHPKEIEATLKAGRKKYGEERIICVFQPHQYQRTYYLFSDFVKVFQGAIDKNLIDNLIITDIYSVEGREKESIKRKVSSKRLIKAIDRKGVSFLKKEKIVDSLKRKVKENDIVILMGAGDIYDLSFFLK